MLHSNLGILASRSLGRRDVANLVRLIESRPGILRLSNIKTNYISSREVKLMAQIRFNLYYIKKRLLQDINHDLLASQLTEEERRRVESLLSNLVDLTVTHTTEVVRDMEEDLRKAFPNANYIDLEYILSKDKKRGDDM